MWKTSVGHVLTGHVLTVSNGEPCEAHYMIDCSDDWVTRELNIQLMIGMSTRRLVVRHSDGRWTRDHESITGLEDVRDVDLAFTPATNTLPLRRLALELGESRDVAAVWVHFPELTTECLEQRYTRIGTSTYRYESGGGAFTAVLDVDEYGMVVRYGDLWERVAP